MSEIPNMHMQNTEGNNTYLQHPLQKKEQALPGFVAEHRPKKEPDDEHKIANEISTYTTKTKNMNPEGLQNVVPGEIR